MFPYYYAGIKCYDVVAGRQLLRSSYVLSKSKALELFPMLKADKLVGALVYYDGETRTPLLPHTPSIIYTQLSAVDPRDGIVL